MSKRTWTPEQKAAASERMKAMNDAKKAQDRKVRVPLKDSRDILNVTTTPEDCHDRWVSLEDAERVQRLIAAGYEPVSETTNVGDQSVDNNTVGGHVTRTKGKTTLGLFRTKKEYFEADQADKQREVDATEETLRRDDLPDKPDTQKGGMYGGANIGRR